MLRYIWRSNQPTKLVYTYKMSNKFADNSFYAPHTVYAHGTESTLLRNPHIARNEEIQLLHYPKVEQMRKHYCGHLTNVVMVDSHMLAAERLGDADFDGDMIKTIADPVLNACVKRNYQCMKNTIPCEMRTIYLCWKSQVWSHKSAVPTIGTPDLRRYAIPFHHGLDRFQMRHWTGVLSLTMKIQAACPVSEPAAHPSKTSKSIIERLTPASSVRWWQATWSSPCAIITAKLWLESAGMSDSHKACALLSQILQNGNSRLKKIENFSQTCLTKSPFPPSNE